MKIRDGNGGDVEAKKGMTVRAFNPYETEDNCEFIVTSITETHLGNEYGEYFPRSHFSFTLVSEPCNL